MPTANWQDSYKSQILNFIGLPYPNPFTDKGKITPG